MNWYKKARIQLVKIPRTMANIKLFINPDPSELSKATGTNDEVRGFVIGSSEFWIWSVYEALHYDIWGETQKEGISIIAYISSNEIYNVMITDFSRSSDIHESPDIASKLLQNKPFISLCSRKLVSYLKSLSKGKKFNEEDHKLNYYNEAIVGRWDESPVLD